MCSSGMDRLMDHAHGCLHKGERRGITFASRMCQELALEPQRIQDERVVSQPPCMAVGILKSDPVQQCVPMRKRLTVIFTISTYNGFSYVRFISKFKR